jgi:hypothetical protein
MDFVDILQKVFQVDDIIYQPIGRHYRMYLRLWRF